MSTNRYFAFISYSRADLRAASFIQSQLEHFRYPRESIKLEFLPDDPKFVREIFLDRTKLSGRGSSFEKNLESALATSRYLILLCSTESASIKTDSMSKHYVEWEISTFLRLHGENAKTRIIPVIVNGEPDLTENSCLPRPVRSEEFRSRNLPDMRPVRGQKIGLFGRKRAWHSAVVTLLSYIFDVERSIIFDRFAAERAKAKMRLCIATSLAVTIILGLTCWLHYEHQQKQDTEAWLHFSTARQLLEQSDPNEAFNNSSVALAHLSLAKRLPTAHEYLRSQFTQRKWIVPQTTQPHSPFAHNTSTTNIISSNKILSYKDFPLAFSQEKSNLIAFRTNMPWKIEWKTKDNLEISYGTLSPLGNILVVRTTSPEYGYRGYDPFSGEKLWSITAKGAAHMHTFSNDGRFLAILSYDGLITILNATSGKREYETYHAGKNARHIRFSNDGTKLLYDIGSLTVICQLMEFADEKPIGFDEELGICRYESTDKTFSIYTCVEFTNSFFKATYDNRTFHRRSFIELVGTNWIDEPEPQLNITNKSHSIIAKRIDLDKAQLFCLKTHKPISNEMIMPQPILHLKFVYSDQKEYLVVAGGPKFGEKASDRHLGFYALIDTSNGHIVRKKENLEGRVSSADEFPNNRLFLHGSNNYQDWITTLPKDNAPSQQEQVSFSRTCALLSGQIMDQHGILTPRLTLSDESETSYYWHNFIQNFSVEPTSLQEYLDDYIGICMKFIKEKYASNHPWLSTEEINNHFAPYTTYQWREAISANEKCGYFSDKITSYWVNLAPNSSSAKKNRDSYLDLFGKKSSTPIPTKEEIFKEWAALVSNTNTTLAANNSSRYVIYETLAYASANSNLISSVIADATAILSRQILSDMLKMGSWQSFRQAMDPICRFATFSPGCSGVMKEMFTSLIQVADTAFPKCYARRLSHTLKKKAIEFYISTGEKAAANSFYQALLSTSNADWLLSQDERLELQLPSQKYFDVFITLLNEDTESAYRKYNAYLNGHSPAFVDSIGRQTWVLLSELRRNNVKLGKMQSILDALNSKYLQGVTISKIIPGKAAERLGWQVGDRIITINDIPIYDNDLCNVLLAIHLYSSSNNEISVVIQRNGKRIPYVTKEKKFGVDLSGL